MKTLATLATLVTAAKNAPIDKFLPFFTKNIK
jgi:hypothetical protein